MHRRLGASEHAIWLGDQITPLHFALTARIVGEFRIDQLEQALIEVQQRHPMLRVRIALGQLQLEAIYRPAVMNMFRTVHGLIGVATVRGQMFFTLTYSETQMSPVRAKQYQQKVMQHLKS